MSKIMNEWFTEMPWGKLALASWGQATNPPVLLVHGFMDTAATFIPLIHQLPDQYYYVGLDMPGHGKSEPFPPGLITSQLHIVEVIRRVVLHMKWPTFIYMAHSMGCVIGMFYNYLYPGRVKKFIHLDPAPPISIYYYVHHKPHFWYKFFYDDYFDNYERYNSERSRLYTTDEAVHLVARNRELSEEQSEIVLSRSMIPKGDDKYVLSWELRAKKVTSVPVSEETLYTIVTKNSLPTLVLEATDNNIVSPTKEFAKNIMDKSTHILPNYTSITIEGTHDVHITNPELLVPHIEKFLKKKYDCGSIWSKL